MRLEGLRRWFAHPSRDGGTLRGPSGGSGAGELTPLNGSLCRTAVTNCNDENASEVSIASSDLSCNAVAEQRHGRSGRGDRRIVQLQCPQDTSERVKIWTENQAG